MISKLKIIGPVPFPAFNGERVYMLPFQTNARLPDHLSHWQATIDAMLAGVLIDVRAFLMIDQSEVKAGTPQRRPGIHIDGYWVEGKGWTTGDGGWKKPVIGFHGGTGGHGKHRPYWSPGSQHEALMLASDVSASRAFVGEWQGEIADGGDCCHIDTSALTSVPLEAGIGYAGNVTMLHESLPVAQDCRRTLVRINVPGYDFTP